MTPERTELDALTRRLGRLERHNRRLKLYGAAGLLAGAAALLMGQAAPAGKSVEAREIVLRDAAGVVRARLAVKETGAELALYDAKEKALVRLVGSDTTQGLYVRDASDRTRATLSMVDGKPRLGLNNAEGGPQTEMVVNEDGPSLVLYDRGRNGRVWLSATENTGGVALYDARALRASLSVTELGPVLLLSEAERKPLAVLSAARRFPSAPPEPSLVIYDADGRMRAVVGAALGTVPVAPAVPPSPSSFALYDAAGGRLWSAP